MKFWIGALIVNAILIGMLICSSKLHQKHVQIPPGFYDEINKLCERQDNTDLEYRRYILNAEYQVRARSLWR
jgi:hypothetical protein